MDAFINYNLVFKLFYSNLKSVREKYIFLISLIVKYKSKILSVLLVIS